MRRPLILVIVVACATLAAFLVLLQTPGSLGEALAHPIRSLIGTQQELNSTLLDVSENSESVRAAGRRLLQPLGVVRLVRIYDPSDLDHAKKH